MSCCVASLVVKRATAGQRQPVFMIKDVDGAFVSLSVRYDITCTGNDT
jgi:hypothetical protein